jgi:hypothetical protein
MQVTKVAPSILMRMGQVRRRTPTNRNGLLGSMSHHHRCDPPLCTHASDRASIKRYHRTVDGCDMSRAVFAQPD